MLQSATSESKAADPRVNARASKRMSASNSVYSASGFNEITSATNPHPLATTHHTVGNQALLRNLSVARPALQAKLAVNTPGDQFEQEADRVSERVMRMAEPGVMPAVVQSVSEVQRTCSCGGTCDTCQEKSATALRAMCAFTPGSAPIKSVRSMNALAYTVGPHIAFASGYYSPASPAGRRLLAQSWLMLCSSSAAKLRMFSVS